MIHDTILSVDDPRPRLQQILQALEAKRASAQDDLFQHAQRLFMPMQRGSGGQGIDGFISTDDDRAVNDNSWTVGFSLDALPESEAVAEAEKSMETVLEAIIEGEPALGASGPPAPFSWCKPAAEAVIGGPFEIHARQVPDLLLVRIPVWFGLLDFRLSFLRYQAQIDQAHHRTTLMLDAMASVTALTALLASLDQDLTAFLKGQNIGTAVAVRKNLRFRFAIFVPRQRSKTLMWVAASRNHDRFQAMRHSQAVRREGSLPGYAYDKRVPLYFGALPADANHAKGTLHGNIGVAAGSEWTVAVPIFNPTGVLADRPRAILTIDAPKLTIDALRAILNRKPYDLPGAAQDISSNIDKFFYKVPEFGRISEKLLLWH